MSGKSEGREKAGKGKGAESPDEARQAQGSVRPLQSAVARARHTHLQYGGRRILCPAKRLGVSLGRNQIASLGRRATGGGKGPVAVSLFLFSCPQCTALACVTSYLFSVCNQLSLASANTLCT